MVCEPDSINPMRRFLTLAFLLTLSVPAWCIPALIGTPQACGGTNNCTTAAINTTGANFLIVTITEFGGTPAAPTDSKSNSWTGLTDRVNGSIHVKMFFSIPSSVGTGHTFTISSSGRFPGMTAAAFSGVVQTSPLDVENGAGAATTSVATGSITPAAVNSLLVTSCGTNTTSTNCTVNSGFSTPVGVQGTGSNESSFLAFLVQNPKAAINPTWTDTNSSSMAAAIGAFKPIVAAANAPAHNGSGVW